MQDKSKLMQWGVLIAAIVIVLRIVLERIGAAESVAFVFGVAWLYFIFPVLFALQIRVRSDAAPYWSLLKNVFLFVLFTRLMVMITYMLAYLLNWPQQRFAYPGGNVGPNIDVMTGLLIIPVRNILIWLVMATIIGMIIGSITLFLKRRFPSPSAVT